ncbi:vWA domain-containing protein [Tahibacter amnicola]|uniref:VWA domain-containing protein n=1 Tax=Tahibacter amnicola TaxID=2976241 RepID=A0ABY6BIH2_9GAMM|nr:VWA domain-containing protein [Tahibacter amnicola]UXI68170.1 VWA domain-containing protein [Tahibacter amnicola]
MTYVDPIFLWLRSQGLKPSLNELLALLGALQAGFARLSLDEFYHLARLCLVKDETQFDRFDRAFGGFFAGVDAAAVELYGRIPEEWLRREFDRVFTDEEKAQVEALGGLQRLMEQLQQRLAEQDGVHRGGSRWIGTGGTSPFGNSGYNPEGVRIGGRSGQRRAVKVWDKREFRNLDDTRELGTRDIKLALRALRRLARTGAENELDLDGTIRATARNAGWLDLKLRPERHNAVKVLLLLDIGGSMDDHVRICEEVFSAARAEFKHLQHYYFHNFVYERVWRDNARRWDVHQRTLDLLHTYPADYKLVIVGDASMSPYEITEPGGSIEHMNEEAGAVWLKRLTDVYRRAIWLNPVDESRWNWTPSIGITRELMDGRMFPLTLAGLNKAVDALRGR